MKVTANGTVFFSWVMKCSKMGSDLVYQKAQQDCKITPATTITIILRKDYFNTKKVGEG